MSVLQVSLIAMVAVLLAIQLKGGRAEYGFLINLAAGIFLFFCIACVILTVLSYWLIRRKKYKADAWMKIVVFGFALAGCLKLVSFWISILLILPVVFSVFVVFREE